MAKQTWEEAPACRTCDKLEKEIAVLKKQIEQANFELAEMQVELANCQVGDALRGKQWTIRKHASKPGT